VKSLVELTEVLLLDCGRKCGAPVQRDVKTLRWRVDHEGDSFITIALPLFCRDFERCLDKGRVDPGDFAHFKRGVAGLPAFLSGILLHVFDAEGALLSKPSTDCIRAVRQICLFGKKIERPCTKARATVAVEEFAQCDCQVSDSLPSSQLGRYFRMVSAVLTADLDLDNFLWELYPPKHGPGVTREGITGNQKYHHRVWHERLEEANLGFLRYGLGSDTLTALDVSPDSWPVLLDPGTEPPSRVVTVPKTMKSPRVIAIEPVCMQYMQQPLAEFLKVRFETAPLTKGRINIRCQEVNRELAQKGSKGGFYATLDLSEASDRVSVAHVTEAFRACPDFLGKVMACRSTCAELPSGEVMTLSKFASMGSALCFPVEALVFFTSIIASRLVRAGLFPTRSTVERYGRDVYVYGDDLIVPGHEAPAICADLEALGLKVNKHKSFWTGKFRESCGSDWYDGEPVQPVYLRCDGPANRADVDRILSWVATANQLETAGLSATSLALRKCVENIVGSLPHVDPCSPAVGWFGFSMAEPRRRWNPLLMRGEIYALVPGTSVQEDSIEGQPALMKCLLTGGQSLNSGSNILEGDGIYVERDVEHLSSSPRPFSLALKRRWVPSPA